jgi:hypothetical protein
MLELNIKPLYLSYHENKVPRLCKSILSWHDATYVPCHNAIYDDINNEHQPHQAHADVTFNTTGWFKQVHPSQANPCNQLKKIQVNSLSYKYIPLSTL